MTHPAPDLIAGYATGDETVDDATLWAVEAHLEVCPACRARLAEAVRPDIRELVDLASVGISAAIATGPAPAPLRPGRSVVAISRLWPWLASAVAVILIAIGLDHGFSNSPSLVLLLAPITPLLPTAAVWSRRLDPLWELLATAPRGGLRMLLVRTLGTLLAMLPVLAGAGWLAGHSSAVWLLPCLALTAGSLLLGDLLGGVDRAAAALSVIWAATVIAPSLSARQMSAALTGPGQIWWSVLTVVLLAALGARLRTRGGLVE